MTAAVNLVAGSGLRYPRAYRPNKVGRQCWANFATEAWKSPEEPPETVSSYSKTPLQIDAKAQSARSSSRVR